MTASDRGIIRSEHSVRAILGVVRTDELVKDSSVCRATSNRVLPCTRNSDIGLF